MSFTSASSFCPRLHTELAGEGGMLRCAPVLPRFHSQTNPPPHRTTCCETCVYQPLHPSSKFTTSCQQPLKPLQEGHEGQAVPWERRRGVLDHLLSLAHLSLPDRWTLIIGHTVHCFKGSQHCVINSMDSIAVTNFENAGAHYYY